MNSLANENGNSFCIDDANSDCGILFLYETTKSDYKAKISISVCDLQLQKMNHKFNTKQMTVDKLLLNRRNQSIKHVCWLRQKCSKETLILIRLFKDIRRRFKGFEHFNPWMMEVLLHYCSMVPNNLSSVVQLNDAFLRAFQLLSAGILLPGIILLYYFSLRKRKFSKKFSFFSDSKSILDPLEMRETPIQKYISSYNLDRICCTAQTLLRVMNYTNGLKVVLGIDKDVYKLEENTTIWDGIYVTPSIIVCDESNEETSVHVV